MARLKAVSVGQQRFTVPDTSLDARNVLVGEAAAVRLATIEQLVAHLSAVTHALDLNDVATGIRVAETGGGFEITYPLNDSQRLDLLDGVVRPAGAELYVGGTRHFVRYRDARAPLGYDVDALAAAPDQARVFYGAGGAVVTREKRPLSLKSIALSLALLPDRREFDLDNTTLYVTAATGLAGFVRGYLYRREESAREAVCDWIAPPDRRGARGHLFEVTKPTQRLFGLLARTPGLNVYRSVTPRLFVALGYRHRLALPSIAAVFEDERLVFFPRRGGGLEVAAAPGAWVPVERLAALNVEGGTPEQAQARAPNRADAGIVTPLRLIPGDTSDRRAALCVVPRSQLGQLRALVAVLPRPVLDGCRVYCADDAWFVRQRDDQVWIPVGLPLYPVHERVFLPLGYDVRPALTSAALADQVGARPGTVVCFTPPGGRVWKLDENGFVPLTRALFAQFATLQPPARAAQPPAPLTARLAYDEVGAFALWGYDVPAEKPAS